MARKLAKAANDIHLDVLREIFLASEMRARTKARKEDPEGYDREEWAAMNAPENTNCDMFDDVRDEPWEIDAILD